MLTNKVRLNIFLPIFDESPHIEKAKVQLSKKNLYVPPSPVKIPTSKTPL
jgi:hypothetical protein